MPAEERFKLMESKQNKSHDIPAGGLSLSETHIVLTLLVSSFGEAIEDMMREATPQRAAYLRKLRDRLVIDIKNADVRGANMKDEPRAIDAAARTISNLFENIASKGENFPKPES